MNEIGNDPVLVNNLKKKHNICCLDKFVLEKNLRQIDIVVKLLPLLRSRCLNNMA